PTTKEHEQQDYSTLKLLASPRALYRLRDMLQNYNYIQLLKDNDYLPNPSIIPYPSDYDYENTINYNKCVEEYLRLMRAPYTPPSLIEKAIFKATICAKDQYYTQDAFSYVVYDIKPTTQKQVLNAAWDNLGMLFHVLSLTECEEPYWLKKTVKYLLRILGLHNSHNKFRNNNNNFTQQHTNTAAAINTLSQYRTGTLDKELEYDQVVQLISATLVSPQTQPQTPHTFNKILYTQMYTNLLTKMSMWSPLEQKQDVFKLLFFYVAQHYTCFTLSHSSLGGTKLSKNNNCGNHSINNRKLLRFLPYK
ncbi:MAG: hypothetical protein H9536_01140, partial [Aphanizomenon flos-aquae Clear-A1]|nr:hypothetical protein [Aphanizomenon flos-aquae Clear-A1]